MPGPGWVARLTLTGGVTANDHCLRHPKCFQQRQTLIQKFTQHPL